MGESGQGLMLVISAPSGAGKTTLGRRLVASDPRAVFSVSATTRPPRAGEQDGVDYTFVDAGAFERMIDRGELLEWAVVHGHRYGTPRRFAEEARGGRLVVFDVDVQGGLQIKAAFPEAATVFVEPPSMEELERRLRTRRTEPEELVRRRLEAAQEEMARGRASYDYLIVNDDLERALGQLRGVAAVRRGEGGEADRASERAARRRP